MKKSYNEPHSKKQEENKKDKTEIKLFAACIVIFAISLVFFYYYQSSKNKVVYHFSYDSETTPEQTIQTTSKTSAASKKTTTKSSKTSKAKRTSVSETEKIKTTKPPKEAKTTPSKSNEKDIAAETEHTEEFKENEPDFPLDINSVTYEQLLFIPNIGEKIAGDIINFRNSAGGFYNMENLLEIDGIGQKRLELLCGYLYVSEQDYREITISQPAQESTETTTSVKINTTAAAKTTTTQIITTVTTSATQTETTTTTTAPPMQEEIHIRQSVNVNTSDPQTIADCLLIDLELAEKIQTLSQNLGGITNINELLLIEGMPKSLIVELQDYIILK